MKKILKAIVIFLVRILLYFMTAYKLAIECVINVLFFKFKEYVYVKKKKNLFYLLVANIMYYSTKLFMIIFGVVFVIVPSIVIVPLSIIILFIYNILFGENVSFNSKITEYEEELFENKNNFQSVEKNYVYYKVVKKYEMLIKYVNSIEHLMEIAFDIIKNV